MGTARAIARVGAASVACAALGVEAFTFAAVRC